MKNTMHYRFFFAIAVAMASLGNAPAFAQDRPQLRVLTYNIHHGEGTDGKLDLERIAKIITAEKPDIVALQEVDKKTKRTLVVDQAAELSRITELHVYFGRSIDHQGGEYGNAILSNVKPTAPEVHRLPNPEGTEPRTALSVRLDFGKKLPKLIFVDTHLCAQRETNRIAQAKEINRLFPVEGGSPILLAGDLNARDDSDAMKEFETQWKDTLPRANKIDYVLTRKGDPWRVIEAKVIDDRVASDHRPVLVVLEWTGAKR